MRHRVVLFSFLLAPTAFAATSPTVDMVPDGWTASGTDDITTSLHLIDGQHGKAACLDFNFNGVSGGATLQKRLPIDWPGNFELSFDVRGSMPANDLQVKFIDASGDNVWWYRREALEPTATWQTIHANRPQVEFAWGPAKDHSLHHTQSLAFTVYAGRGGKGELCVDQLHLRALPPEAAPSLSTPVEDTPNARLIRRAAHAPRGMYPRGFSGEQSYWTLVGSDGGAKRSALISEDGAVEVRRGGWSIEPMIFDGRHVIDWASANVTQSLQEGYLPIPTVHWRSGSLSLDTTAIATGTGDDGDLLLQYTLSNAAAQPRNVTLALMARPFQVNPPSQFLNSPGGISPIHELAWDGRRLQVNGELSMLPLQPGATLVASGDDAGNLPERLLRGERPFADHLHDDAGLAQGALLYTVAIPAHGQRVIGVAVPGSANFMPPADPVPWLQRQRDDVAGRWRESLNRVTLTLPQAQQAIVDTARTAVAQILMSRDGPALQPGTRSYGRTWVRDGAMMSEGLLRSGHGDVAAQFVRWYAPYQFSNGKVPCCVDARGSDPVPENDSQGELIFATAQLWRYRHDRAEIEALWPHIERAVAFMDHLRAGESLDVNRQPGRAALLGLMPASISHEGYSAKPMHSYWDDFWALVGYDDAATLAKALGKDDQAARIARARDDFRGDLLASIRTSVAQHRIDYVPGAAELGDFDATSTTVALSPGDGQAWLPHDLLDQTFERYWRGFAERRDGKRDWDDYTPYELRVAASFVRLGWRDRVGQLLAFFMADRRPAAWNQWAEVVGRDPRKPRFVGDMPHAWIASDYVRSIYDMFAYERTGDHAIVLGAGMDPAWFKGEGVGIRRLRTPYGELSYRLHEQQKQLVLDLPTGPQLPPGGYVFPWPFAGHPATSALLNGKPVAWQRDEIIIRTLPARLEMASP